MSNFEMFMKANKVKRENQFIAATSNFIDENGQPVEWEVRHLTTKEANAIREDCTTEVPVMTPEELIFEMIDDPTEFNEFLEKIQNMSGLDKTLNDKVEEAKN